MLHGAFNIRPIFNTVDSELGALEPTQTLGNGFDLNRIEGDECRLTRSLALQILDALDADRFLLDNDRVDVATENSHDGGRILVGGGSTKIDDSAIHAGKETFERGDGFFESDLALSLLFVLASLHELVDSIREALVDFGLFQPDNQRDARLKYTFYNHSRSALAFRLSSIQLSLDLVPILVDCLDLFTHLHISTVRHGNSQSFHAPQG